MITKENSNLSVTIWGSVNTALPPGVGSLSVLRCRVDQLIEDGLTLVISYECHFFCFEILDMLCEGQKICPFLILPVSKMCWGSWNIVHIFPEAAFILTDDFIWRAPIIGNRWRISSINGAIVSKLAFCWQVPCNPSFEQARCSLQGLDAFVH